MILKHDLSFLSMPILQWMTLGAVSLLLCVLAFMFIKTLRKHSPATKHLIAATTMGAHLLLFFGFMLLPKVQYNVIPSDWFETTESAQLNGGQAIQNDYAVTSTTNPNSTDTFPPSTDNETGTNSGSISITDRFDSSVDDEQIIVENAGLSQPVFREGPEPSSPPQQQSRLSIGYALPTIWLAGFSISILWLILAYAWTRHIVKQLPLLDTKHLPANSSINSIANKVGIRRLPQIKVWNDNRIPMQTGILKTTIVVPSSYADWSQSKRRHVLMHELVHIARRDSLHDLIAWLAASIFWFNPCIWILKRKQGQERELACDQTVVSISDLPEDYAADLVSVVREASGFAPAAGIAMARSTDLRQRIESIIRFDPKILQRRRTIPWLLCMLLVGAAGLGSSIAVAKALHLQESGKVELIATDNFASTLSPELRKIFETTQKRLVFQSGKRQSGKISINGKVVDQNDEPVAGATVYLRENPIIRGPELHGFTLKLMQEFEKQTRSFAFAKMTTSKDGAFEFVDIETPKFRQKTEYTSKASRRWSVYIVGPEGENAGSINWHSFHNLESTEPVKVVLPSPGKVTGIVADPDGEPVSGAKVTVIQVSQHQIGSEDFDNMSIEEQSLIGLGFLQLGNSTLSPKAISGPDGRFVIDGLTAGYHAMFKVEHPDFVNGKTDRYPIATLDSDESISLEMELGWRLSIVTKDASGEPVPKVNLSLIGKYQQGLSFADLPFLKFTTDENGEYLSPLLPKCGVRVAMVRGPKAKQTRNWIIRPHAIQMGTAGKTKTEVIELQTGRQIHGRIVSADKSNPLGKIDPADFSASFFVIDEDMFSAQESYKTKPDSDGRFVLHVPKNVIGQVTIARRDGNFEFDLPTFRENSLYENSLYSSRIAEHRKGAERYLRLANADPLSLMPSRRDIEINEVFSQDDPLELPIARSTSVSGTLVDTDGKPVAGAKLEMLNKKKVNYGATLKIANPEDVVTDADGKFTLTGIQKRFLPTYRATHPESGLTTDFGWESFSDENVRIRLEPGPSVRAIVTLDGNPLPGQEVTLHTNLAGAQNATLMKLTTDETGSCIFKNVVRCDDMAIQVVRSDKRFWKNFSTLGDETVFVVSEMNFISDGSGIVAGTILTPDGTPVANADVYIRKFTGDRFHGQHFDSIKSNNDGYFKSTKVPPNTQLLLWINPGLPKEARYPRDPMRATKIVSTGDDNVKVILDPRLSQELPWRTSK